MLILRSGYDYLRKEDEDMPVTSQLNQDYYQAHKMFKLCRYGVALEHATWAQEFLLYEQMRPITDEQVKEMQAIRLECFHRIRTEQPRQ